jgi:hypothetical protein
MDEYSFLVSLMSSSGGPLTVYLALWREYKMRLSQAMNRQR